MERFLKGGILVTQTTQPRSWATLSEMKKDLTINKPETEDNARLLFMACDSLNGLYESLIRLSHEMDKKIMEYNLSRMGK